MTEGAEAFKAAAERIRSGESEAEEVELPSGRVRLTPDPQAPNGINIQVLESDQAADPNNPDPATKASMEKMKEVMERFRSGELDRAEIPLPSGETMELTRDDRSPGAFVIRSPDGEGDMLSIPFEAASSRSETYPEDLPFLPDTSAALMIVEGRSFRSLTWFITGDPGGWFGELRLQLVADGWLEHDESNTSTAFGTITAVEFENDGVKRTVMVNRFGEHSQLKLLEHPK